MIDNNSETIVLSLVERQRENVVAIRLENLQNELRKGKDQLKGVQSDLAQTNKEYVYYLGIVEDIKKSTKEAEANLTGLLAQAEDTKRQVQANEIKANELENKHKGKGAELTVREANVLEKETAHSLKAEKFASDSQKLEEEKIKIATIKESLSKILASI